MDLPAEILIHIFDLAADDDLIFQYGLQTSFSVQAWHKAFHGDWQLRSPREALNYIQKRSYFTKKAIVSTCRKWRGVGSESLFRYLFFDHPSKLLTLCRVLRSESTVSTTISSSLGWWTRRIHLANRDYRGGITMADLQNALVLVMKHCPNLEIFIVDSPMGGTFGPAADALAHHAFRSLRTVHWQVPADSDALAKVIWALDSLPYIVAAHIHFTSITDDDEDDDAKSDFGSVRLGSASNLHLNFRYLQQLSLKGQFQEFIEQARGWSLRALQSVSFDYGNRREELPDVITFLRHHGSPLRFLDINCIPMLDVSKILDSCPNLHTFAFNPDWRIMPNDGISSELARIPHFNITTIGLHGLYYAFGVGHGAAHAQGAPITAQIIRKSNDMNVAALNKLNFPKLECVRILSSVVLKDLERENGPSGDGVHRYDNWWNTLSRAGIHLEDCTGAPLGTLPQEDEEDDGEMEDEEMESGEDEEEEERTTNSGSDTDDAAYQSAEETFTRHVDDDDDDDDEEEEVENELDPGKKHVTELHRLLEECRVMEQTREELPYASLMTMAPGGPAYSGETDYGAIYQTLTGNGNTTHPRPTTSNTPDSNATFGFAARGGGGRPRVSFGISDEPPPLDDPIPPSHSETISGRSSGRSAPPHSLRSSSSNSQYAPQSRRTSSQFDFYAPSESDMGTLLGVPEDSPAISSTATLVADDDSDDGYRYQYGDGDDDDDENDDDEYDDDDDDEEDRHPVATLRKLLEECRAMRGEAEEPMLNPMMFGGAMGMGMGSYGMGVGYPGMGRSGTGGTYQPRGSVYSSSGSTYNTGSGSRR